MAGSVFPVSGVRRAMCNRGYTYMLPEKRANGPSRKTFEVEIEVHGEQLASFVLSLPHSQICGRSINFNNAQPAQVLQLAQVLIIGCGETLCVRSEWCTRSVGTVQFFDFKNERGFFLYALSAITKMLCNS